MSFEPNPTRLDIQVSERQVDRHRNLYCHQYERCLDHAISQGWESWSCMQCPLMHSEAHGPTAHQFAFAGRRER